MTRHLKQRRSAPIEPRHRAADLRRNWMIGTSPRLGARSRIGIIHTARVRTGRLLGDCSSVAMTDFKRIDFADVPGGALAACERLPNSPGVYGFFSPTPVLPTDDPEEFIATLNALVEQRASPVQSTRAGSLYHLTLDNFSHLSQRKQEVLREHAQDANFREELATIVERCMPLRAPLYVGQTATLQTRIKQHLAPSSDLAIRLRSTGLAIDRCVIAYRLMPDIKALRTPEVLTLTEEIVTRLLRPGYVSRIG